jgi:hypothetical protein
VNDDIKKIRQKNILFSVDFSNCDLCYRSVYEKVARVKTTKKNIFKIKYSKKIMMVKWEKQ